MAGVGYAEFAVSLVDGVVEGGEGVVLGNFDDEPLEVFSGVVGWGDGEELLTDIEVKALGAGEVDFVGVWFEVEGIDSAEAVDSGEVHVLGAIEVEDKVAKCGGVEASVALEGVAGFEVEQAVVALRSAECLELLWEVFGVDVAF